MENWTRKELKSNAKTALRGSYWLAFLVSFLATILISGSLIGGRMSDRKWDNKNYDIRFEQEFSKVETQVREFISSADAERVLPAIGAVVAVVIFAALIIGMLILLAMIAYSVFIANPVVVGHKKFYIENRKGNTEAGKLLSGFGTDYKNIVRVMFTKNLQIILWSLLFVIPGIVKAIEYFAVDYLMAEYPRIETKRALKLSGEMTRGLKWEIFKLALSFLGWVLLCVVSGGIGFIFLTPYVEATFAELYVVLSGKPISEMPEEALEAAEIEFLE